MNKKLYLLLLILCCLMASSELYAQKKKSKKKPKGETSNTSYNPRMRNIPPASRDYMSLYRTNTRGVLMGNKCLDDYTRKMGFQYVVMPPGQEGSLTETEMRFHNFGVKFLLLMKNGPFWHHRLNKRIRRCREKSGDFMGQCLQEHNNYVTCNYHL